MDWIIKNIILNNKIDWVLYGLMTILLIVVLTINTEGNENMTGFYSLIIAIVIVGTKEIINYSYKKLYFANQSKLNSIRDLINNRQYIEVVNLTKKIRLIKPQLTEMTYGRGVANLYLKESKQALEDFNSIELEYSNIAGFFYYKGMALADMGKYLESIEYITRSIELEKTWQNLDHRGVAYMNLDRYEEAEKDLRESIKLEDDSTNMCNLGVLLDKKGQYVESIEFYNRSIEINSSNPNAFYNRALANYYLEKYQDSISDNTRAIELDSENPSAYYNRASSRQKINEYELAVKDYNSAAKFGKVDKYLFLSRGFCKCEFGDISSGLIDLKKASELDCKEAKDLIIKYDKL